MQHFCLSWVVLLKGSQQDGEERGRLLRIKCLYDELFVVLKLSTEVGRRKEPEK